MAFTLQDLVQRSVFRRTDARAWSRHSSASVDYHTQNAKIMISIESTDEESMDQASAISWGAAIAGAAIAAAASLALLSLGAGLGLSAISAWSQRGISANTFGLASIVWAIVTQLCASALGGYLSGRLRARWSALHVDEVYFRDTTQGLLSWAVATLVTATILLTVATSVVGTAAKASSTLATGAAIVGTTAVTQAGTNGTYGMDPMAYWVDSLFRKEPASSATSAPAPIVDAGTTNTAPVPLPEVTRIFVNASGTAALPAQDVRYLGQLVSQHTGLQQADAEHRVTDTFAALQTNINNAKTAAAETAEKARKAGIQAALWLFIALLSGAFIASYAATIGGRERDL